MILKNQTILYLIPVSLFLLGSCEKSDLQIKPNQVAYFEYEYINYAWGYQHAGWIIDNSGKVLGYNLPDAWTFPDSAGFISETDLEMNLSQTDTVYNHQISTLELDQQINLIPGAAKGKLSEKKSIMADAGGWGYWCYIWDNERDKYKKVLLDQKGDLEQTNLSAEAHILVSWLKQVSEKL